MSTNTETGAPSMRGRSARLWDVARSWFPIADDSYLFYTAALVPIVVVVALITREGDLATAALLGAVTLAGQLLLGTWACACTCTLA